MAIMVIVFFIARERRQDHDWDYPGDAYAVIEAVAWAVLYLLANLKASPWLSSPDEVGAVLLGHLRGDLDPSGGRPVRWRFAIATA